MAKVLTAKGFLFFNSGTAVFSQLLFGWDSEIYIIGVDLSYVVPDSYPEKGAVLESTEDIYHFERLFCKEKVAYTKS